MFRQRLFRAEQQKRPPETGQNPVRLRVCPEAVRKDEQPVAPLHGRAEIRRQPEINRSTGALKRTAERFAQLLRPFAGVE